MEILIVVAGSGLSFIVALVLIGVLWTRWGSTGDERKAALEGDDWFGPSLPPGRKVVWTRAVSVRAPADAVWSFIAQLGRGAGFYSLDRLDNGGKSSASDAVSWIPAPRLGDSSAIGYLRHVVPGRELAWWTPVHRELGIDVGMVAFYRVLPEGDGSRLVMRVGAYGSGALAFLVFAVFAVIDSIMACKQLQNIRARAEALAAGRSPDSTVETGAMDQFQYYEFFYADGTRGGVPGKEGGARWHEAARKELGMRMRQE